VQALGRQIIQLPEIFLAEYKEASYGYSLQTCALSEFQRTRLRRYRSPFVLNSIVTSIPDKFQQILAIDVAFALIQTFQESHDMCSQNLLNMYLAEEVKHALPEVLLTVVFSLSVHSSKPFYDKPAFFAVLLNSLLEHSKS
jgi:hypothetical protein